MKNSKYLLSAVLTAAMAFQPAAVLPVNVSVTAAAETSQKTDAQDEAVPDLSFIEDAANNYYCVAVGMHGVECTVPSEYNGKKVGQIDLNHVYIADYDFPSDIKSDTVTIHIPDGMKVGGDFWLAEQTGVPCIRLVYESGKTEVYKSADYDDLLADVKTQTGSRMKLTEEEYRDMMLQIVPFSPGRENVEYPILEIDPRYNCGLSTYKDEKGYTYLKVETLATTGEIHLPAEFNGEKIDRLKLGDIHASEDVKMGWGNWGVTVYLPDSIWVSDLHWVDTDTGFSDIILVDEAGNEELFEAELQNAPYIDVNSCNMVWQDNAPNISLNKIAFTCSVWTDDSPVYAENLYIEVPEKINVIYDHWKTSITHIMQITLKYPSGKTVTYKSEDYEDYLQTSGRFKEYNRIMSDYDWMRQVDDVMGEDTAWILSSPDDYERLPHYTDADKLVVGSISDYTSAPYIEELVFPDNIKKLTFGYSAFDNTRIGKLVLPDCPVNIDRTTWVNAEIKEIVFGGDATLPSMLFYGNQFLENVTFKGKAELENTTFWKCEKLKNINISPDVFPAGVSFNQCRDLMTINGESPVNDDGSIKPEYEKMFKEKFYNTDGIGFVNKYVDYSVKKAVSEAVTDDMSDMEKVKALHDKLCSMTRYDHGNTDDPKNHVDVSVFLNDSTVCEGYARAMNLMLHEAGVESCYVDTDTHAWVIVKLGDHYFHVDPTWDDNDEDITTYNWFMKADSEIKDDPSHSNWKMRCPSIMHNFQWEKMPACEDKMGDVNGDDIIDGRDATDILTAYAKASVGDDMDADKVIADFDYNGKIDARDASAVLTAYAKASASEGE